MFALIAPRIPHYEQRLKSLHYKKRFMITVNDLIPRIRSVMEASREIARSRRLRKLLELVLALGEWNTILFKEHEPQILIVL